MIAAKHQVIDVNHYDDTIIVKYEDGTVRLLNGAEVRRGTDEQAAGKERMDRSTVTRTEACG